MDSPLPSPIPPLPLATDPVAARRVVRALMHLGAKLQAAGEDALREIEPPTQPPACLPICTERPPPGTWPFG